MEPSVAWPDDLNDSIAYLEDWLLSHALEMRIITLPNGRAYLRPTPTAERRVTLQFVGHHGVSFC